MNEQSEIVSGGQQASGGTAKAKETVPGGGPAAKIVSKTKMQPATIVIFGAGGDLTKRLVIPALYHLAQAGKLPEDFTLVGVDHHEMSAEQWRDSLSEMMRTFTRSAGMDLPAWSRLTAHMQFMSGDFTRPETFTKLAELLPKLWKRSQSSNTIFYLATPDRFFGPLIEQLGNAGLTRQSENGWRRVIIEKPFGHDLASAKTLNAQILKVLSEDQIYRIDHYLGKETVQNILVLRFANGIFEPIWNRDHINHIQITAAETLGVEGRGNFYEKTGALRDMVPNHLFQLLGMIGMEPPISFSADAVRTKTTELFQAVRPVSPENAVRGQYGPGTILGHAVKGYREEPDVDPQSTTETYAAFKLSIDNWRWAGVPFYLRTGKRLTARTTEISVQFRRAPYALFRETPVERLPANILTLRIQPNEGLSISFSAKRPGPEIEIDGVAMDFAYRDYFAPMATVGYETLIYDCLIGDATLFQRADTVEAGWFAVQNLLDTWTRDRPNDFPNYAAGSAGPEAADKLLARDGRAWLPIRADHPHTAIRPNVAAQN
ncbi:MAG TPA: glucose-6-phosphate dehydrogenase [Methylovirgula sp.]|jgi:glucose-6-phosphate 1-dehydrogenase|nr:glucose-6-phosphate dehydrogenase [Methylovirgula sp.]